MLWIPSVGDRIKTIVTKDKENEVVYLNGDHVIDSSLSDEFLIITGEWIPWPHQIIDHLSSKRNYDRELVLKKLISLDAKHKEATFDELCQILLAEEEAEGIKYFSTGE